ncbi:Dipeptidyl peptidase 4 [Thelohanellus kitauei]|uniref:Dipeptidyl peptidase 4 n=1 Tax=Thelohanellus kitauei TaxID=669202 RepID=A0A0C2MAS2_THEKT|nr:Dipeptidyl peptidase 4 [Thelohanellus kitauei]
MRIFNRYYKELNPKANFIVIGWSYGGYLTLTCIKDYPDIISNGVAIAPVVDWRFYDSFYTERYMGLPTSKDNLEGYEITSLLNNTTSFKNAQLFLIHGTSDDNVHFENSAKFVDKLTQAGIFTRFRVFPFKNHGISGQEERKLLVKEIGQFISDLKEIWHKNRDLTTQQSVQ